MQVPQSGQTRGTGAYHDRCPLHYRQTDQATADRLEDDIWHFGRIGSSAAVYRNDRECKTHISLFKRFSTTSVT